MLSILHLPDLHFASPGTNYQDDSKEFVPPAFRTKALDNLISILQNGFAGKYTAIAVGGDITTRGDEAGFGLFEKQAAPLLKKLVANPRAICIVPGNHDVVWKLPSTDADYFDRKFRRYRQCVKALRATSCLVPTGSVPGAEDGAISFDGRLPGPLYVDKKNRLQVLCVNSAMRCGELDLKMRNGVESPIKGALPRLRRDSERRGLQEALSEVQRRSVVDIPHVTQRQLSLLTQVLSKARNELKGSWHRYIKVALVHHHLVSFTCTVPEYKPFEIMPDATAVLRMLASYGFQLVLTGHKHEPYIQPFRFENNELLVVGGRTVGGGPAFGTGQPGFRHIEIDRTDLGVEVRVADILCDSPGDPQRKLEEARKNQFSRILHDIPVSRRPFPLRIESAVEDQLYGRQFFRKKVRFNVVATLAKDGDLCFETEFSYTAVNRTDDYGDWPLGYRYHRWPGSVEELRIRGKLYDPDLQGGEHTPRGLNINVRVQPREEVDIYLRVKETWPTEDATLYTSYYPATDLTVVVTANVPNVEFKFEPHYFMKPGQHVTRKGNRYSVEFPDGVLPFEGLLLHWKRKERENGHKKSTSTRSGDRRDPPRSLEARRSRRGN